MFLCLILNFTFLLGVVSSTLFCIACQPSIACVKLLRKGIGQNTLEVLKIIVT